MANFGNIVDQMINYSSTSTDLEEYLIQFMVDEINVVIDEENDDSYKEIVVIILKLYQEGAQFYFYDLYDNFLHIGLQGKTIEFDKLRILDEQVCYLYLMINLCLCVHSKSMNIIFGDTLANFLINQIIFRSSKIK